jgi:Flp pilus assembly protein TadD
VLSRLGLLPVLAVVAVSAAACTTSSPPVSNATSADKLVSQGLNAESIGQNGQAMQDFNAAAGKDPTNKYAYYDLGVIYQQQNDAVNAAAQYHKALLVDANYKPALFNLAVLETSTNPQDAIAQYNHLLQLNPTDSNVNFNLGLLLIAQGQGAAGHADLKKAIQVNPALASRLPAGITP